MSGWPWTPQDDARLRERAGHPLPEIAEALGRTVPAVANRLTKLRLRGSKEPQWTDQDLDYLRRQFGQQKLSRIAKTLGRTPTAVKVKAKRLGLRHRRRPELTPSQIGRTLRICSKQVKGWIRKGWLQARLAPTDQKRIHLVAVEDLVAFERAHPECWDARRCPDLHIRLGLRPQRRNAGRWDRPLWLREKLAADLRRKRRGRRWTPDEDRELARLMRRGLRYREIGERLRWSELAVKHRAGRLGQRIWNLARVGA